MMQRKLQVAVLAVVLFFPGFASAENLATLSDLDLIDRTRAAVVDQDADSALALLTEMQRRETGIFADVQKTVCEERIGLPDTITDWRFKGAARQAYITAAKSRRLDTGSCECLFSDFGFGTFSEDLLGKPVTDLVDSDRSALEDFLAEHQRDVEGQFRDLEKRCRAK